MVKNNVEARIFEVARKKAVSREKKSLKAAGLLVTPIDVLQKLLALDPTGAVLYLAAACTDGEERRLCAPYFFDERCTARRCKLSHAHTVATAERLELSTVDEADCGVLDGAGANGAGADCRDGSMPALERVAGPNKASALLKHAARLRYATSRQAPGLLLLEGTRANNSRFPDGVLAYDHGDAQRPTADS